MVANRSPVNSDVLPAGVGRKVDQAGAVVSEYPQWELTYERKPHYTWSALFGLGGGAVFGALVGVFIVLVVLGGAGSWNDTGGVMGGRDEQGLTFVQTLTWVFAAGGAVIGGIFGSVTGLVMAFSRRPSPPNKNVQPRAR